LNHSVVAFGLVGGLAGANCNGTVAKSITSGNTTGIDSATGGLVGYVEGGTLKVRPPGETFVQTGAPADWRAR